ncbi:Reverse transcriptase (RNA-dependent DNA polymerase) [Fragilaria crotonensis]|nr:Reverse transcriptase (RNA-dependent DNA polymerase) [Fragilaria crotonensis]
MTRSLKATIAREGVKWILTPTHASLEATASSWNTRGETRRLKRTRLITHQRRYQSQQWQRHMTVQLNATFVLIINEALFFGESLSFSLLSRTNYETMMCMSTNDIDSVIAGFTTRLPTQAELDDVALHVELTSDVEWIPSNFALSLVEEDSKTDDSTISTLRARRLKVLRSKSDKHRIKSCIRTLEATQSLFEIETANEVGTLDNDPILRRVAALTTYEADTKVYAIRTGDVTSEVTPENVAKRWLVGIETAKKTLNVTTQKGVRSIPNPATRRFKTQMAHLRYPRMGGMFYADIMEPKVLSLSPKAEDYGGGDAVFLLPKSAKPIVRSTVWSLTPEEKADMREDIEELLKSIDEKIGNDRTNDEVFAELGNDVLPQVEILGDVNDADEHEAAKLRADADEYTPEAFDKYLSAQIVTDRGGEMLRGTVKSRKRDSDGKPIDPRTESHPDTREYIVCFEDGTEDTYMANLIAECIYSQIDENGRQLLLMQEIIDHKKTSDAISEEDSYYSTKAGPKPKRTTRGWRLLVEWKDGTSTWVSLADIKDSYPVQVADYAVANKLTQEPAFRWWVPFVLKKRERLLKKVKTKYWSVTHKYGLELPKSVAQALAIDKRTGTDFWEKAIEKEIRNVFPAFEFLKTDDAQVPPGFQFVETYFVFDIKMDLTRKARLVARGSMTEATKEETFASVVSRDTVRLFFLLAALNDLDVLSCDIQNAYLAAPNKEKVWTKFTDQLGPEYNGKKAIIAKALYGLRSSGRSFRDYLAMNLRELGFISSKADPDLWMRSAKSRTETTFMNT